MKIEPISKKGYALLHHGAIELAIVEANGFMIDTDLLEKQEKEVDSMIRKLKRELYTTEEWKKWRTRFGSSSTLTSRDQLGKFLEEELKVEIKNRTPTGRPKVDEETLSDIKHPFVEKLLLIFKLEKLKGTFLKGVKKETAPDSRLHPFFHLHTARTFRSSSERPNFQNFPVRDKMMSKFIRSVFVPSPGCVLLEADFKGIEVAISACYHKDPNFVKYISTPGMDMHRDMAAQIFFLKPEEVTKPIRYGAKNKFVFPQFYGDFYVSCARSLWEWIRKGELKDPKGRSLYEHLKDHGIEELGACDPKQEPRSGTFEYHVREVERDFWNRRFKLYGQWRKDWWESYLKKGYFDLLTGFRIKGVFPRNAVVNYPIQGTAFHCLLWSLIQINREIRKRRMKTKIVGQIHDSLIADVPIEELHEYLCILEDVTTRRLKEHWKWIIVPLEVEYEISLPGTSWYDKVEMKFKDGYFIHPQDEKKRTKNTKAFLKAMERIITKEEEDGTVQETQTEGS